MPRRMRSLILTSILGKNYSQLNGSLICAGWGRRRTGDLVLILSDCCSIWQGLSRLKRVSLFRDTLECVGAEMVWTV